MTPPELELVASARIDAGEPLPALAGFFASDFAPLVYAAVRACVGNRLDGVGDRVAIVLGSHRFDTVSLELSAEQADQGRVSPILFYQVLPTAILGQIARDYRLTGPVSCVAVTGDAQAEVWDIARVLLADASAELVLGLSVELNSDPAKSFAQADLVRLNGKAS
jgi:3-oxoacyl-(acyl-carrier-protein) synthase